MMGKKRWMFFRKLRRESSSAAAAAASTPPPLPLPQKRWRLFGSAFKWRRLNLQLSFFDDLLFRVVSVLEAVVLVITLAFFYLFCGCHF